MQSTLKMMKNIMLFIFLRLGFLREPRSEINYPTLLKVSKTRHSFFRRYRQLSIA